MKRLLLLLAAALSILTGVEARNLRLVYIAHDVDTPVEKLVGKIEKYSEVLEEEADDPESVQQTIIYMSSSSNPLIANMKSGNTDRENFDRILSELSERNYHEVDTDTDMERILALLSENEVFNTDGSLDVTALKFEFYVTPGFWTMHNNENLIASLFFALGIDRYRDPDSPLFNPAVNFQVFFPNLEDRTKALPNESKPFGEKNVNNINKLLTTADLLGTY